MVNWFLALKSSCKWWSQYSFVLLTRQSSKRLNFNSKGDFMIIITVTQAKSYIIFALLHSSSTQNLKVLFEKHLPGEWEIHFFWQMREEELWDFVTQEAQSVSAHWCSELAGLSLWSPINSVVRLLPPSPHRAACSYRQPTAAKQHQTLVLVLVLFPIPARQTPCPVTFSLLC